MRCGVGHRCSLDPELLWLWLWSTAVALIGPLAWETPCDPSVTLKRKRKKKKAKKENKESFNLKELHIHGSKVNMPVITLADFH